MRLQEDEGNGLSIVHHPLITINSLRPEIETFLSDLTLSVMKRALFWNREPRLSALIMIFSLDTAFLTIVFTVELSVGEDVMRRRVHP